VPSAAGGWHIPSFADGGILAKVHGGEMILPKDVTDKVLGGGSGGDNHLHLHAMVMDGPSLKR
jgi:hypothetical protein